MTEKKSKLKTNLRRFVLYPLLFLLTFVFAAYLTFPYDHLKRFIIQEVEYPRGPGGARVASGYQLEIVDLSPSWFTGAELKGVTLRKPITEGEDAGDPLMAPSITFEEVNARVGVLALLTGTVSITFDARGAGGTLEGEVAFSEMARSADVAINGLELRRATIISAFAGLPMNGDVSGTIKFDLDDENIAENTGEADLDITGFVLGDGRAKLSFDANAFTRAGLTIPETSFGDIDLQASVMGERIEIQRLLSNGDDIQLDGRGELTLRSSIMTSSLDIGLRLTLSDAFKEENAGIVSMLESVPRVRAAQVPDTNALQFHVDGNIGPSLRFRGDGRSPPPSER